MSTHDQYVISRINHFIDTATWPKLTVATNLDGAQAAAERARTGPHDLVGRDAEYYLKARSMIAASHGVLKVPYAVGGTGLSLLYNGIKAVAIGFGFEEQTRTDPDVPVTPPGGNVWIIKESVDGISDDGSKVGIPAHAKLVD